MTSSRKWNDQRVEKVIADLLRGGVLLSALIVFAGAIFYLIGHGASRADYHTFHGEPPELKSVRGILRYASSGHGRAIIQLGLLVLIATPVARVAFSIFGFAAEGDRMYVGVSMIVLLVLLYSLFGPALMI
jgi:uncharacterized membrane protein